jgi:hypothetical protein
MLLFCPHLSGLMPHAQSVSDYAIVLHLMVLLLLLLLCSGVALASERQQLLQLSEVQQATGLGFPAGSTVNGTFTAGGILGNLFDPADLPPPFTIEVELSIPAGSGNSASPNNVAIGVGTEFALRLTSTEEAQQSVCSDFVTTVDITTSGLLTYSVQLLSACNCGINVSPIEMLLTSAVFSNCTLTAGTSSFPTVDPDQTVLQAPYRTTQ